METILTTRLGFNPFIMGGITINRIYFIKDSEIICQTRWFGSNNPYKQIVLPFEIKKATKVDLTRNFAFWITKKDQYTKERRAELYIPIALLNYTLSDKTESEKDWESITTWRSLKIRLNGTKKIRERINPTSFEYVPIEGEFEENLEAFRTWEHTEQYNELEKKCEIFRKCGVNIYPFEMRDLEKHFTITLKA